MGITGEIIKEFSEIEDPASIDFESGPWSWGEASTLDPTTWNG